MFERELGYAYIYGKQNFKFLTSACENSWCNVTMWKEFKIIRSFFISQTVPIYYPIDIPYEELLIAYQL